MLDGDLDVHPAEKKVVRVFEENTDFHDRLEDLLEIVPNHPSYDSNGIVAAFHRAIRRQPLTVPPPPTDPDVPSVLGSRGGRQTKIQQYFRWSRKFPDLPMEVILEIASHMAPLTLLHFSRTSKLFRKKLMNKASRWAWQGALHTVLGLPPCPEDMNEALYTALVFDSYCFACGCPDALSVDYALRLRLCESCWDANVVEGASLLRTPPEIGQFVTMLLPSANTFNFENVKRSLTRVNPQTHIYEDVYHKLELKALLDFFLQPNKLTSPDITNLRNAFLDRAEDVMQRQMVHPSISFGFSMDWHMNPDWHLLPEDAEDDPFDNIPDSSPDTCTIAQGVILNSDPPKSRAQISREHRRRADRESASYDKRLAHRYHMLAERYEDLINDDWHRRLSNIELPTAYDGARLFSTLATANDARTSIDDDTVDAYSAEGLARVKSYTSNVHCALEELLPPAHEPRPLDEDRDEFLDEMLRRPTALFVCDFPSCHEDDIYEWDQITAHWSNVHRNESVWRTPAPQWPGAPEPEGRKIRARFWDKGVELVNRILDAAGLARDTSMWDLLSLCIEGRLYCVCGDPLLCPQNQEISWSEFVWHVHGHLEMDRCRRPRDGIPWINDHGDLSACIKVFPEDVDISAVYSPVTASPDAVARVEICLNQRPSEDASLICSLCEATMDDPSKVDRTRIGALLETEGGSADYIVYHMRAKHGIGFDEKNVRFKTYHDQPPQKMIQTDLRRFCRA